MNVWVIILSVFYILSCAALVTVILLQKKRSAGMGSLSGMGQSPTYWDKNKGRSVEGALEKFTKLGIAVLLVFTFVTWLI